MNRGVHVDKDLWRPEGVLRSIARQRVRVGRSQLLQGQPGQ